MQHWMKRMLSVLISVFLLTSLTAVRGNKNNKEFKKSTTRLIEIQGDSPPVAPQRPPPGPPLRPSQMKEKNPEPQSKITHAPRALKGKEKTTHAPEGKEKTTHAPRALKEKEKTTHAPRALKGKEKEKTTHAPEGKEKKEPIFLTTEDKKVYERVEKLEKEYDLEKQQVMRREKLFCGAFLNFMTSHKRYKRKEELMKARDEWKKIAPRYVQNKPSG